MSTSFDPSDPAITQEILNQVSTMLANDLAKSRFIIEQQKNTYVKAKALEIFKAYNEQVCIVGQCQLNELNSYYRLITNQQSTLSSAISTLSEQLANTDLVHYSSFSTLLTMPYVPTCLKECFEK